MQCTTCGHTFNVQKPSGGSASSETLPSPPAAEWLLETSDGRLHRFRNLTSLQKWIIERKVTRDDKISRTGQAWRRLGEIVELAPFFDVVDEADRARAAQAGGTPDDLKAEAQRARRLGGGRATPPAARPLDVSPQPKKRTTPVRRAAPASQDLGELDALGAGSVDDEPHPDYDTQVVPVRRTGLKVAIAVLLAGGIGAAALIYLKRPADKSRVVTSHEASVPPPAAAPPPAKPSVAATPPAEAPVPSAATESAPSPATSPPPSAPTAAAAPAAPAAAASGQAPPVAVGYEGLVSEADRLLENGATDKAAKLYDRALKSKPTGVEALAGMGYVMLDKERMSLAMGFFERAIAQAPSYGPALFGLAEAQRAEGDEARAIAGYKRYLQVNPSGEDAPAARRQLKLLEERAGAAAPASPPPSGPPPSPSSVLGEPAAP